MKYQRIDRKIKPLWPAGQWIGLVIGLFLTIWVESAQAQQIRFIEGTHQSWSGGICCRHGSNYNLKFKWIPGMENIRIDTLWTHGYCHPINLEVTAMDIQKDSTFKISRAIVWDDNNMYPYHEKQEPCYYPELQGIFLVYSVNGIRRLLNLKDNLEELVPLAYP